MEVTEPDVARRDAFIRMLDDYSAHDPNTGEYYEPVRNCFSAYVQGLKDEELGLNIQPGYVPCSHRWLVEEGEIVGIVRIRHHLNTQFIADYGHIGYDVPPSVRGRGYGIRALRAGLDEARLRGIARVLVCADAKNPASWKTIERCGGVLEEERFYAEHDVLVRRYWIEIGREDETG